MSKQLDEKRGSTLSVAESETDDNDGEDSIRASIEPSKDDIKGNESKTSSTLPQQSMTDVKQAPPKISSVATASPKMSTVAATPPKMSTVTATPPKMSTVTATPPKLSTVTASTPPKMSSVAATPPKMSTVAATAPRKTSATPEPHKVIERKSSLKPLKVEERGYDEIGSRNEKTEEMQNNKAIENAIPNNSILMDLVEQDTNEFDDIDMDEMLPKSKFQDKSFNKLKSFFDIIIADLTNARTIGIPLDEVKEEFNFVFDAIQKSHDNLESLLHKDLQLSGDVADKIAKTRNLIRIAEDHPEKAIALGRRLETAWNIVDVSKAEEKRNTVRLEELEADITVLNRSIAAAANMEGRTELNEMVKIKKNLAEERDSFNKELGHMKTSLVILQERKLRQVDEKIQYKEMIMFADEEAIAQNEAVIRETARKARIENAIKETIQSISVNSEELTTMETQMSVANEQIDELERTLRDQKVVNDVAAREAENSWAKHEKLKGDVTAQVSLVERLAADAYKRQTDLKTKEDDTVMLKMEGARIERQRIANVKKCDAMQETLDALEQERENLRNKIQILEKDLEKAQKKLEQSKREVEDLDKQRTAVNRNLQRAVAMTGDHENQMKINAIAINNLDGELDGFKREIVFQTDTVHRLERERDFYSHEATKLAHLVASRVDYIKRLDMSILESKRSVAELEYAFKSHQQTYESVIVEKMYNERILRDAVNEILVCSKSIRDARFEKYGLEYREADMKNVIIGKQEQRDKLMKETGFLKTEANRMLHNAVDMQRETEALEAERSTLSAAIATAENEISKQRYYANGAESRKANYHRKLMKQTQELRDTWEKWRSLHSMVRIGAYHYRNVMKEIREMRQTLVVLRNEQLHFKGNTSHVAQLRQEISALENCIAKETCMVNALIEELKRPINIHRWRVLETMDPDAFNLVKKINIVTKRLVDHNEQIRKQNIRINDQERIFVDIKDVTKHLPGLETPEERQYLEVLYDAKKQQLEFLKHEMYANEAQTAFFRQQVLQLNKRMEELRQAYLQKKNEKTRCKKPKSKNNFPAIKGKEEQQSSTITVTKQGANNNSGEFYIEELDE